MAWRPCKGTGGGEGVSPAQGRGQIHRYIKPEYPIPGRPSDLAHFQTYSSTSSEQLFVRSHTLLHRRRLVINIGGQKFGSQILGGKNFEQIYFQTKNLEKFPSILFKISD